MRKLLLMLLCLLLVSCATEEPPRTYAIAPPPPPPPAPVVAAPVPAPAPPAAIEEHIHPAMMANPSVSFLARVFLYPDTPLDTGYANIVLFTKKPVTKQERDTVNMFCENWKASFPEYKEIRYNDLPKEAKAIPFYWLLKKKSVDTDSCRELVDNYDYNRARALSLAWKLQASSSYMVCKIPQGLVTMDITKIKKESDLEIALRSWQNKMTVVPTKAGVVHIYTLADSIKVALGALSTLVALK